MKQWGVLFKKEMIGHFRDRKWIWVPLVLIILAVMDPVTNYYMPQILDAVGGLPEGSVFEMPEISEVDAIKMSISQLSSLGVLIISLISMGTIATERKSGIAELILVKPVAYPAYILSKWAALLVLVLVSYLLSMLFAWYYIGVLYGFIPVKDFLLLTSFYGLWLMLVVTVSIFYNTLFRSSGLVAFSTIATLLLMSGISSLFGERLKFSPNQLSAHAFSFLHTGEIPNALYGSAVVTIVICVLLLLASVYIFHTKEHAG